MTNPIAVLDDEGSYGGENISTIAEKVYRLESDPEYRRAFFAVPLLAPTATARMLHYCDKMAAAIRASARTKPALSARMDRFAK